MDRKEIINRISYFRTKAKLSQKALSFDIDMNAAYINRLESKKDFLPSVETLLKIIEACGITTEEFFYEDMQNYQRDKAFLAKIKNVPNDKVEAIMKLL